MLGLRGGARPAGLGWLHMSPEVGGKAREISRNRSPCSAPKLFKAGNFPTLIEARDGVKHSPARAGMLRAL